MPGVAVSLDRGWQNDRITDSRFEPGTPARGTELLRAVKYLTQSTNREEFQHLRGRSNEGSLATAAHAYDLVTKLRHVRQGVSDDNDRYAIIGQAAEQAHDLPVGALVEPAGHFVEQQQARAIENLAGQARAFLSVRR